MKRKWLQKVFFRRWIRKNEKVNAQSKCREIPFADRKREFLSNLTAIIRYLDETQLKEGRKHLLLYISSGNWSYAEVKSVIDIAQKRFAEVSIYIENSTVQIDELVDYFFDEYGLRLSVLGQWHLLMQKKWDTVLCLSDVWDEKFKMIICQNAYAVCETEGALERVRKKIHISLEGAVIKCCKEGKGDWYSGFAYANNGRQMHYMEALSLLYGLENVQGEERSDVEKTISIVAIYGIE